MIAPFLALPAVAAEPAALDLLAAQRVVLDAPERAAMLPEGPEWREGWLLVLRVAPERAALGQGLAPLLWVGEQPVSRLDAPTGDGCVVALVEGPVDLAKAPVFWGPPELAERLRAGEPASRVAEAVAAGARPLPADRLATATLPEARLPHGGALPALAAARRGACGR